MKRINSKADLRFFIERDRINNKYSHKKLFEYVKHFVSPNRIVEYLDCLRRLEYHINVSKNLLLIIYYKRKHEKLGMHLGFSIPPNTCGPGLSLPHYGSIIINPKAQIGDNCRIHSCVNIGASGGSKIAPVIGDNVYIAPGAIVFGEIKIGNNNTIGANATVNKSFEEEHVVIAGTPAVIVKRNSRNWIKFNQIFILL